MDEDDNRKFLVGKNFTRDFFTQKARDFKGMEWCMVEDEKLIEYYHGRRKLANGLWDEIIRLRNQIYRSSHHYHALTKEDGGYYSRGSPLPINGERRDKMMILVQHIHQRTHAIDDELDEIGAELFCRGFHQKYEIIKLSDGGKKMTEDWIK